MIRFINPIEKTYKAQAWKLLYGPANILDGIVYTLTFGSVSTGLPLEVAKKISYARFYDKGAKQ